MSHGLAVQLTPDATNPTANLSDFRTGLSVNSFPHSISQIIIVHLTQKNPKFKKTLLKYFRTYITRNPSLGFRFFLNRLKIYIWGLPGEKSLGTKFFSIEAFLTLTGPYVKIGGLRLILLISISQIIKCI